MNTQADVVIIGGGIVGVNVAFHLVQRGVSNIILLERRELTAGSTGRSSGVIRQFYLHPTPVEMARYGLEFYRDFERIVGSGSAGFVGCGWMVAGQSAHLPMFQQALALQQRLGATSRLIDRNEVCALVPGVDPRDVEYAFYEPESGYADPAGACISLGSAVARAGVQIRQGMEVTGIQVDGVGVAGVETTAGTIATRTVVNAAGPWAERVARMVGVDLPLVTSRHSCITVRRPVGMRPGTPVYSDPSRLLYIRPESGEQFLVGSNDPRDARDLVDPDLCPVRADPERVLDLVERSVALFPELAEEQLVSDWSGVYTVSPDGFPIIDHVPGVNGFYVANGLSGHGFKLGPAIGRMVTSLIVDGEPEPGIRAFRLSRFAEGDLINSPTTSSMTTMRTDR